MEPHSLKPFNDFSKGGTLTPGGRGPHSHALEVVGLQLCLVLRGPGSQALREDLPALGHLELSLSERSHFGAYLNNFLARPGGLIELVSPIIIPPGQEVGFYLTITGLHPHLLLKELNTDSPCVRYMRADLVVNKKRGLAR